MNNYSVLECSRDYNLWSPLSSSKNAIVIEHVFTAVAVVFPKLSNIPCRRKAECFLKKTNHIGILPLLSAARYLLNIVRTKDQFLPSYLQYEDQAHPEIIKVSVILMVKEKLLSYRGVVDHVIQGYIWLIPLL